jgi:hypothetical protein
MKQHTEARGSSRAQPGGQGDSGDHHRPPHRTDARGPKQIAEDPISTTTVDRRSLLVQPVEERVVDHSSGEVRTGRTDEPAEHRGHRGQVGLETNRVGGHQEPAEFRVRQRDRSREAEALVTPSVADHRDSLEKKSPLDAHGVTTLVAMIQ